jgi:hypothetical protein
MSKQFNVYQRDEHHWDVSDGKRRVFAIRGEPGAVLVRDERKGPKSHSFKTVTAAVAWCADELMSD